MRRRARPLVILAVGAAAAVTVDVLGDMTQTRPDPYRPDHRTEVTFSVAARHDGTRLVPEARALWSACERVAKRREVEPLTEVSPGTFRLVVQPALGPHARERLQGCLRDVTLDELKGSGVRFRELAPDELGG